MFETLTPAERSVLLSKLGSAGQQFAAEYTELCRLQNEVSPATWAGYVADYGIPAAGPAAWLHATADTLFAAAEVSGTTAGPSAYWKRSR